jgi:hypothetical protein
MNRSQKFIYTVGVMTVSYLGVVAGKASLEGFTRVLRNTSAGKKVIK